mgnify:CR=1 FL=1
MISATSEIVRMIDRAYQKKRELEKQLKKVEDRKAQDERELRRFELRVYEKSKRNDNAFLEMAKITHEKGRIKNENKEIAKLFKRWLDVDKKIGQLQRWTKQAELYRDSEKKQRDAVSQATYVFKTL